MASEIESIPQINCSLFPQYYIYNFQYSFTPEDGMRIKIYFVNKLGIYTAPGLTTKKYTSISIVGSPFILNLYPIKYGIEYKYGRRVIWVDFVDDTFKLNNYMIALTNTISGFNIYQLGASVDSRTSKQQLLEAIDPIAQQIKNFTQFQDVEYSFADFLNVVKSLFLLAPLPPLDNSITKNYIGTFRTVLDAWCKFYNLSWYFENGKLNIIDPTKIVFNFTPNSAPADIIEYEYSESMEETYGKTVSFWYQQQGNEIPINGAAGNILTTSTLYPIGQNLNGINQVLSEIQSSVEGVLGDISKADDSSDPNATNAQSILDPLQVVAALYGKHFWFLYNYFGGTASAECGWTPTTLDPTTTISQGLTSLGLQAAILNEDLFEQKYQAYLQYGQNIAGRYYVSDEVDNIDDMRTYQWYNITDGQIFDFTTPQADKQKITMEYALSQNGVQTIPDTLINQYYDGLKYVGNVMWYKDTTFSNTADFASNFSIDPATSSQIDEIYNQLVQGLEGNNSLDYTELTQDGLLQKYVGYANVTIVPSIAGIISQLQASTSFLQPKFNTFNVIGTKQDDVNNLKVVSKLPTTVNIADAGAQQGVNAPPVIYSNGSILRVPKDGGYILYYDKISNCMTAFSDGDFYSHKFDSKNVSEDVPTPQTLTIAKNGIQYSLTRDLTYVNKIFNQTFLNGFTTPRPFNTIEVTYKFNYLNSTLLGVTPVTNGLTQLSIDINENEVNTSITFSNKIFKTPDFDTLLERLELQLKNSWTRNYFPINVYSGPIKSS